MKPVIVNDVDIAFGGNIDELLPAMESIPENFKKGNSKWNKIVSDWFFKGLNNCNWTPKDGIITRDALRHINAIMVSFKPSHEHKEAGCAYLLSEFFSDVEYE